MRILITGGSGFIGSNLCHHLFQRGHEIVAFDNGFLGKERNLKELIGRDGFRYVKGDVTSIETLRALGNFDVVVHMAALSSAPMFSDPRKGVHVNVCGFLNVLELARQGYYKKVIYASTSSLYSAFNPPHSEILPVFPRTFYEFSMYAREHAARIYHDLYGVSSIGLRLFSIYGPREEHKSEYANVITQFLWAALKGEKAKVYGDGSQTRDFTYVRDVCRFVDLLLDSDIDFSIYNVGTGVETSFNRAIKVLSKVTGLEVDVEYVENPIKMYVQRTCADMRKARRELGFKANYGLKDGIREMFPYYKELYEKGEL